MDELVMNGTDVLKNLLQSKDGRVFGVTDFDAGIRSWTLDSRESFAAARED